MEEPLTTTTFERILTDEEKAALRGESFANRDLVGVDLSRADLRGARFEKTLFVRCSFEGADLRGAHFNLCELRGVILVDAVFGENRFDGTTIVEPVGLESAARALLESSGATFQPLRASHR
jgi:uncharacterized protein YjbI with pentapeptide repeats